MIRKFFTAFGAFVNHPVGASLGMWALWHIIAWAVNIPVNYNLSFAILLADVLFSLILTDRLVYFFSQFVLPIQNPKDRQEIYLRVNTPPERRGPAIFIKNGRKIAHKGETEKRGKPGVILLDTASAVVLRSDTEIRDTAGPGVKFTQRDEYISESVDLRAQWQFVGPLSSEQPFIDPMPISISDNNDPKNQWDQTSGLTRDGIEVAATISIKFRIKQPGELRPTESGVTSQYGFDKNSVRKAVTREVMFLGKTKNEKKLLQWNRLPEHLVINLWREYIRKYKLSDLFTNAPNELSKLQIIEAMINQRVVKSDTMGLNDIGDPTTEWLPSAEFLQLEDRGLEILEVRIQNITLKPDVETETVNQWGTEWLINAKKEERQIDDMERLNAISSRKKAHEKFSNLAAQKFTAKPTLPQENPFKTLQLLVEPIKDEVLSKTGNIAPEQLKENQKLEEIWRWLLDNNNSNGARARGANR